MTSAILLAAGRSSRMGAFKPLLPFGEKTVIEACISNLTEGGVEEVVVVLPGTRADELRGRLAHLPVRFAVNQDAESEMGVSVALGVGQVRPGARGLLVALADQPAIPPAVISSLIETGGRGPRRLIIPEYEGRGGHPVWIDSSFRAELQKLPALGGLRALFGAHPEEVLRLPVTSPYVARDMDQWDDYRALYREVFGTEPPENNRR